MSNKKIYYSKASKVLFNVKPIEKKQSITELKKRKNFINKYNQGLKNYNCIICNFKLDKNCDFEFHKVNYYFCKKCNHLNGSRKLQNKILNKIYKSNKKKGSIYFQNYSNAYKERVDKIYRPKLNFLKKIVKNPKILDYGCGAGHFIGACHKAKVNCIGAEIDKNLIGLSPKFIRKKILYRKSDSELLQIINQNKINCISLIHVIEHLDDPYKVIKLFKKSKAKFLLVAVPLFGYGVIIDLLFKNLNPRTIGGGHFHLFTMKSLEYFFKKTNLKIRAEWWFGSDSFDLYRNTMLNLISKKNYNKKVLLNYLNKILLKPMDNYQNQIDKSKNSSDIHLVISK